MHYVFHTPFDQHAALDGATVVVLRELTRDEADMEVGPMFEVRTLGTRETFHAFREELTPCIPNR
jgi:hypothetical protein